VCARRSGGHYLYCKVGEGGEQAEELNEALNRDGPEPLAWPRPLHLRKHVRWGMRVLTGYVLFYTHEFKLYYYYNFLKPIP
jgi:hypothetical protein